MAGQEDVELTSPQQTHQKYIYSDRDDKQWPVPETGKCKETDYPLGAPEKECCCADMLILASETRVGFLTYSALRQSCGTFHRGRKNGFTGSAVEWRVRAHSSVRGSSGETSLTAVCESMFYIT